MKNKKIITNSAKRVIKRIIFRNYIPCYWSKGMNWGDALNPYIIKKISGKEARYDENQYCWKHFVIGSILNKADMYSIIWGTGMIAENKLPKEKPYSVHAVRGKVTRHFLKKAGIECPEVYGDPALLLPRFFNPVRKKKWKIGIIPHYTDQNNPWIKSIECEPDVNVINIFLGIEEFVLEVLSCDCIISSSLHGLICADAYNIPNRRIILNNMLIGDDFKFMDYYSVTDKSMEKPITPRIGDSANNFISGVSSYCKNPYLDELYNVCPFL